MKKGIKKFGIIGLGALALGGEIKEGIAQTTQDTNKAIQADLGATKDSKDKASKTYVATAADFKEKEATDSLDIMQVLNDMSSDTAKLVEFYGKDELSKKIHQIMKEYPNFANLTVQQQKDIMTKYFTVFVRQNTGTNILVGVLLAIAIILFLLSKYPGRYDKRSK